jgi:Arc/MetJ-type ribon-helix-helix transcriptional regulator
MPIIPIPLEEEEINKIDYLVKTGRYKNRIQVIKALIQEKLAQETIIFDWEESPDEIAKKKIIQELVKLPEFSFSIKSAKSAEELIGEERGRY